MRHQPVPPSAKAVRALDDCSRDALIAKPAPVNFCCPFSAAAQTGATLAARALIEVFEELSFLAMATLIFIEGLDHLVYRHVSVCTVCGQLPLVLGVFGLHFLFPIEIDLLAWR
jgi:hypothetical protein